MAGRKNIVEAVVEQLVEPIRKGELAPGAPLPSEMQLAGHFSISRSSARKVLETLETKGLIFRRPGVGSFVRNPKQEEKPEETRLNIAMSNLSVYSYAWPVIPAAQRACNDGNAQLVFPSADELRKENIQQIDGFLHIDQGEIRLDELGRIADAGIPVCTLNRVVEFANVGYCAIDFRREAKRATHFLTRLGLKRIGCVSGPKFGRYGNGERLTGYADALADTGGKPLILEPDFDDMRAVDAIAAFLLREKPDALFLPLVGVLDWTLFACQQAGLRCGEDIQLLCFDRLHSDTQRHNNVMHVDMPLEEMGRDMTRHLIDKRRNPETPVLRKFYETTIVLNSRLFNATHA